MELMNAAEFRQAWLAGAHKFNRKLITASAGALAQAELPEAARQFLATAGLPAQAAPYLDFAQLRNKPLTTLAEFAGPRAESAHRIYLIGGTGSGDPLGIDAAGLIWEYNHDQDLAPMFVNSSVAQLAACLLAYRQLVADTVRARGNYLAAVLSRNVPADVVSRFDEQLRQIDPVAYKGQPAEPGARFPSKWQQELRALEAQP
jgi:hypothetical protein